ncbi:hypothetical protein [Spirosoma sp. KNUC1025]|uniref:hypothetical protein n=1 Tax=Spirosoma sp. KNUC1025 TaxID=2894082 RepID=UPI003865468C|nr:hypothetical protein LN737_20345 [Spirosoma sp. KNUC1025]
MKRLLITVLLLNAILSATSAQQSASTPAAAPAMQLTCAAFSDGGIIPIKFSQAAPGVAPGEVLRPH